MTNSTQRKSHERITLDKLSILKRVALSLVKLLSAKNPLALKLTRLIYGKRLKHMRNAGANLQLTPTGDTYSIHWKGDHVASTVPFPLPEKSEDTLWIMATGPSIRELKLGQLQGKKIMGLNGAIATCLEHDLQPAFYTITDRDFFETRMSLVEAAIKSGAHCFFSFNGIARICEYSPNLLKQSNISLLETVNRYFMVPQLNEAALREQLSSSPHFTLPEHVNAKSGWSHDTTLGVFTGNTIAYIACQIAQTLKFKQAYILGMDLDSSGTQTRSYEAGSNARPTTIDKDYETYILPAFQLLSELELDIQFWNLSPTSRLPASIIPQKSFESALRESNSQS